MSLIVLGVIGFVIVLMLILIFMIWATKAIKKKIDQAKEDPAGTAVETGAEAGDAFVSTLERVNRKLDSWL